MTKNERDETKCLIRGDTSRHIRTRGKFAKENEKMLLKKDEKMIEKGLTHNYVYERDGKIYFSEELLREVLEENPKFQNQKVYDNPGCGKKEDAWIGGLGERCFERLLNILGVGSQWERSEYVNTNRDDPDFMHKESGMTLEIRCTRVPNTLWLKPKDVRNIISHNKKGKAFDCYIGYTTSWDKKKGEMLADEMRTLKKMFADDYTGERPHLIFHGFTTRTILEVLIKNYRRAEIGDSLKPVFPRPLAGIPFQHYMKVLDASNPKYPNTKGRKIVEANSLFRWGVMKKFLTHQNQQQYADKKDEKWERGIHLLE
jgi:hypothetical protein